MAETFRLWLLADTGRLFIFAYTAGQVSMILVIKLVMWMLKKL